MIHEEKPSLDELTHHGIKGMHWGVRRASTSESTGSNSRRRKAAKVGAGVLVVGGAAVATYILAKNGHLPVATAFGKSFKSGVASAPTKLGPKLTVTNKHGTSVYGHEAVKAFEDHVWKTKVSDLSKNLAEANASQDAWMRSIGLGKVVNNAK